MGKKARSFTRKIVKQDMFGHLIHMNFDKQNSAHKTMIGGCFSIFIKAFMFFYVVINLKKLLLKENTTINNLTEVTPLDPINFNETRTFNFHVLRKQTDGPLFLNQTDYIDVYYNQVEVDWERGLKDGRYKYRRVEARQCTAQDFGNDTMYNSLKGYSLICPEINDFKLRGDQSSMQSQNVYFTIDRCHKPTGCKS